MHSTPKLSQRESRTIDRILAVLSVHDSLADHVSSLQFTIENSIVIVRGELPTEGLRNQVVPAVRRAGVLARVNDCIQVSETAAA